MRVRSESTVGQQVTDLTCSERHLQWGHDSPGDLVPVIFSESPRGIFLRTRQGRGSLPTHSPPNPGSLGAPTPVVAPHSAPGCHDQLLGDRPRQGQETSAAGSTTLPARQHGSVHRDCSVVRDSCGPCPPSAEAEASSGPERKCSRGRLLPVALLRDGPEEKDFGRQQKKNGAWGSRKVEAEAEAHTDAPGIRPITHRQLKSSQITKALGTPGLQDAVA